MFVTPFLRFTEPLCELHGLHITVPTCEMLHDPWLSS